MSALTCIPVAEPCRLLSGGGAEGAMSAHSRLLDVSGFAGSSLSPSHHGLGRSVHLNRDSGDRYKIQGAVSDGASNLVPPSPPGHTMIVIGYACVIPYPP